MFGGTSGWGQNNNQNQQNPPQQTNAFGQPAQPTAFGTAGFGQTGAFGQPQQQQTSVFGQPAQNQPQQQSAFGAFGQPRPAFGATGGTAFTAGATAQPSTSTGFGGFGASTASTTAFGNSNAGTTTGGLFGAKPTTTTSAFGTGIGATANNGTASPQYTATSEREGTANTMSNYQSITAMPAYRNFSFEELRLQDYSAGRKAANAGGAFGQASGFGGAAANPTPTTNVFGQSTTAPATGAFGAATGQQTNAFGQPAQTNAFGQPAQPTTAGFGGFGQTAGASTTTGGLFGQNTQAQQQPATNAFGQPAAPATGGGLFGNAFGANTQQPQQQAGGGLFGGGATGAFGQAANNQPKPAFGGFGQTTAQPAATGFGGFGQSTTTQPTAPTSVFGQAQPQQQQQQQQQPQSTVFGGGFGGGFGQNQANAPKPLFGASTAQPTGTGLFGQPAQQDANKPATAFGGFGGGGGLFGQNNTQQQQQQQQQQQPATGGLFGNTQQPQQQQQQQNAFGGFGQTAQQPQQQQAPAFGGGLFAPKPANPPTAGLFGNNGATNQQQPAQGLFGATNQQQQPQQPNAGGGLFGNLGGGLNTGAQQNQQMGGNGNSLFGVKPAGNGLFGGGNAMGASTGAGLFGQSTNNPAPPNSLFGNAGLFSQANAGFGASNNGMGGQQQQQVLTASVDGNIYNTNPLLQPTPGAAHIIQLNDPDSSKKFAASIQYTKKFAPKSSIAPKIGKLRGFATPPPGGNLSSSLNLSGGLRSASPTRIGSALGGLSDSPSALNASGGGINPEAFRTRTSVKKLVLPTKVDSSSWNDSLNTAQRTLQNEGALGLAGATNKPKVTWDPQLGVSVREQTSPTKLLFGSANPSNSIIGGPGQRRLPGHNESATIVVTPGAADGTPSKLPSALKGKGKTDVGKLKRGEYWLDPPIHRLQELGFAELSKLSNFVVGRAGYGKVSFLEPVNLTSVAAIEDIPGKVVLFDTKECVVYPDSLDKPPVGEGLNVPSRIELYECYPVDKATREAIVDENHPKVKAHIKRIKNIEGTTFQSYDAAHGTWVFDVPHYTRYGLDNDEDEDEEEVEGDAALDMLEDDDLEFTTTPDGSPIKRSHPQRHVPPPMEVDQASEEDAASGEPSSSEHSLADYSDAEEASAVAEDDDQVESEREGESEVDHRAPPQRPWPSTLGLNSRKVNVMQASFFHTGVESKSPTPVGGITSKRAAVDDEGHLGRGVPQPQQIQIQLPLVTSTTNKPPPLLPPPTRDLVIGDQSNSLAFRSEGTVVDAGLSMGRCFGARWGPHGKLTMISTKKQEGQPSRNIISIVKPRIFSSDESTENERTQRLLEVQIQKTTIETDEDGIPVATPLSELRFHHYASLFAGDDRSHEASVWRLGAALFDEMDLQLGPDVSWDVEQAVRGLRYKTALSDWLEAAVAPAVETSLGHLLTASNSHRVFILMTGHQIERAAQVATDAHNFNLALLVSQAGGDDDFRRDLASQLAVWKDQKADGLVEGWYRRVYALLAGITDILEGSKDPDPSQHCGDEHIQEGLDWKRAFGLQLWYGTTLDQSPAYALDTYALMCEQRIAAPPLPWYVEDPDGPDSREFKRLPWTKSDSQNDALFEIIRMYMDQRTPLEAVLLPRGFTPSPHDHRMPWHLYILLASVLKYRDFGDRREMGIGETERSPTEVQLGTSELAQTVTVQYAYQLARLGRLEDAVFVLLHLEQPEGRKIAIQSLLREWVGQWDERLIVDSLKVPQEWVSEAYGILACYEKRPYDAFEHFLDANQQQIAHDIAAYSLAREAVIRGDHELLLQLFSSLDPNQIRQWDEQGKLYLDYVECVRNIPELERSLSDKRVTADAGESQRLQRLARVVPALLASLPSLFQHSTDLKAKVALGEMLSTLLRLANPLRNHGLSHLPVMHSGILQEQARLQYVQKESHGRFLRSLKLLDMAF